jgi:hypothetical protein
MSLRIIGIVAKGYQTDMAFLNPQGIVKQCAWLLITYLKKSLYYLQQLKKQSSIAYRHAGLFL